MGRQAGPWVKVPALSLSGPHVGQGDPRRWHPLDIEGKAPEADEEETCVLPTVGGVEVRPWRAATFRTLSQQVMVAAIEDGPPRLEALPVVGARPMGRPVAHIRYRQAIRRMRR